MNAQCPKCKKTVYPTEKLQCLDQTWHKACFTCQVCNMQLNMKNYRGFEKKPYCNAHYPTLKSTPVADTPENQRLKEQSKLQSQVAYHADFEKMKGQYTEVADTPEMAQNRANAQLSGANYKQRQEEPEAEHEHAAPAAPVAVMGGMGMPKASAPARPPAGPKYKAQFPYEATDTDEVSFVEGDVIINGEIVSEGWMKGTVQRTGKQGLLPSNYVEEI